MSASIKHSLITNPQNLINLNNNKVVVITFVNTKLDMAGSLIYNLIMQD